MDDSQLKWAINTLESCGYKMLSAIPNLIQNTPWSEVYSFETNHGFIFLKKVPEALAIEVRIITILDKEFNAHVPNMIAENTEQHCFLMKDAGMQLHEYLKKNFEDDILIEIMKDYTKLQILSADKLNLFLDMGVPDWRLKKLPRLYQNLISQEKLLLEDGLNNSELIKLKQLQSKIVLICEKLSSYNIKDTFGHADFHDKNILINIHNKRTTLIDLGEVVVTHPFFSFLNCLHMAKENFSLSESQYQQLQIECFKPWLDIDTQEHLFEILSLIQQCWSIHAVLGELRLINSVDQISSQKLCREGRLAIKLRYWIDQF